MTDVSTEGPLVLDGALTIRDATSILERLREMIDRHQTVSIECSSSPEIDLSFIQLLVAARASASNAGRTVALATKPAGALLNTLTRGGFRVIEENSAGAPAFWFAGASA